MYIYIYCLIERRSRATPNQQMVMELLLVVLANPISTSYNDVKIRHCCIEYDKNNVIHRDTKM